VSTLTGANDRSWPKSAGRCQAGFDPKQTFELMTLPMNDLGLVPY
jgi:hypothetical protein